MSDKEPDENRAAREREIEREIRASRQYSLAEALGRSAGDLLKGESPTPALQRAAAEIGAFLESRLRDPEGALSAELRARLKDDPALLSRHLGRPLGALAEWLERTLGSPALLELFTRDVDARWGRMYSEKPRFDSPGQAPAHDDPYTLDSMRETLRALQEAIGERRA